MQPLKKEAEASFFCFCFLLVVAALAWPVSGSGTQACTSTGGQCGLVAAGAGWFASGSCLFPALSRHGHGSVFNHVFLPADHAPAAHLHQNVARRHAVFLLRALGKQQQSAVETSANPRSAHGSMWIGISLYAQFKIHAKKVSRAFWVSAGSYNFGSNKNRPKEFSTSRYHAPRMRSVVDETHDTKSVAFDVPPDLADAFACQPGQFLNDVSTASRLCKARLLPGKLAAITFRPKPTGSSRPTMPVSNCAGYIRQLSGVETPAALGVTIAS